MRLLGTVVAGLLALSAQAQQLAGTQMFVDYPGLSDNCKDTLATNVTCPPLLLILSQRNRLLNEDEVGQLCTDDCHSSLKSARATIEKSCTLDTDVLVFEEVAYPASFIVDQYLLAYDVSCQKDNAGHYCDPQLLSSRYKTNRCSTCWLNSLKAQLNSPLGYDEGLAENFDSLTSSCNATGYSYTSPTAYALNTTSTTTSVTATATPTQTCARSYKVQPEDDCNSVAKAMNVSTYYLLEANHLDLYCQTFANKVGKILCVPPQCTTHTWGPYDTCDEVVAGLDGVTLPQFLAWNPNFSSLCLNSPFFYRDINQSFSPPGGYLDYAPGNGSSPTAISGGTSLVAAPTNAMDGSNHNCSQWYTVEKGDTCADLSLSQSISLTDFYFLNPEVNQNCTNLQLGEAYCVRPVGSISSYPNYTATGGLPITVTSATFPPVNTDIPTRSSDPGFIYTPPPAPPKAPGTISDCYKYDYIWMDGNSCDFLSFEYNVPFDDLVQWNPSLDKTKYNCTLSPKYSYCVKRYENSTVPEDTTTCLSINATEPGTASNCNCFTYVDDYDKGDYTCDDIIDSFDISLSQLLAWNTWLAGSDCTVALFANLGEFEDRSVCVGAGDPGINTASTSTGSEPASTTSTESKAM